MIFEITGIRFQMKGATKDEQTTKAEQFSAFWQISSER